MAEGMDPQAAQNSAMARILSELHRCEHGRHEGDPCYSCEGGMSSGNLLLPPGTVIGHTLYGHEIVVPPWERHYDPKAWVRHI